MSLVPGWQRRRVWYSGHVQGVGFRQTTLQISRNRTVTGWVRNLPDGRVELVAEGTEPELDRFLADIDSELGSLIRGVQVDQSPGTGEFGDFQVTH